MASSRFSRRDLLVGASAVATALSLPALSGCSLLGMDKGYFRKEGTLAKTVAEMDKLSDHAPARSLTITAGYLKAQFETFSLTRFGGGQIDKKAETDPDTNRGSQGFALAGLRLPDLTALTTRGSGAGGTPLVDPTVSLHLSRTWGSVVADISSTSLKELVQLDANMQAVPRLDLHSQDGFTRAYAELRDLAHLTSFMDLSVSRGGVTVLTPNLRAITGVPEAASMSVERQAQARRSSSVAGSPSKTATGNLRDIHPERLFQAVEKLGIAQWSGRIGPAKDGQLLYGAFTEDGAAEKKEVWLNADGQQVSR